MRTQTLFPAGLTALLPMILAPIVLAAVVLAPGPAAAQKAVPIKTLPFSAARQAGDFLYVSGQVARTPDGADVKASVDAETRQVMDNVGRVLAEHGYSFDDVVRATVWLKDIEDYHEMNAAYASYFENGIFPARACVGGAQIVFDFRVEISVVAWKEGGRGEGRGDRAGDRGGDRGGQKK